jgi:uncharacterized protein YkwD
MRVSATKGLIAFGVVSLLGCSAFDPDDGGFLGGSCGSSTDPPEIGAWDAQSASFEERVLELTNEHRAQGGCCGTKGCFESSAGLANSENLRAAARLHARDMSEHDFFSHVSLDGRTVSRRVQSAGFGGCRIGENIAQGQQTPEAVVAGWMQSDGHCANILLPKYNALGIGHYDNPSATKHHYWVQNFGG